MKGKHTFLSTSSCIKIPVTPTATDSVRSRTTFPLSFSAFFSAVLALSAGISVGARTGAPLAVQFVDVAGAAGVGAVPNVSGRDQKYIVETSIGGSAFFDYDSDGDIDLYVVNGSSFYGFPDGTQPYNRLYRNEGGAFVDVSLIAGVADTSWGLGCAVADYDNDGHADLFVANIGRNRLYRNLGDGTFADVATIAGVADDGYGTAGAFGDYDLDGDLDLYVSNYIEFSRDYQSTVPCVWKTHKVICGPRGLLPQADIFYRNNGDGTFSDVTEAVGMAGSKYYGYQVVFADFTNDGWPDAFVADDMTPNKLFINEQNGTFSDAALGSGVGFSAEGAEQGCMGVGVGDYDGDGRLDIFVTNFEKQYNTLYRNEGEGFFLDASYASRVASVGGPEVGWGTALFDYDNDGDRDIFVANGHTYPEADLPLTDASYAQPNFLLENLGDGTFRDVSSLAGPGLAIEEVSRGAVFGDYDDDGDIDIFVLNLNGYPNLLRNDGGNTNNYLYIKTVGTAGNRDGVGTRIEIELSGVSKIAARQVAEVSSGGSYLGHNDIRVHFGLGSATVVDRVTLRWPGGAVQELHDVAANQVLMVTEPGS